MRALLPLLALAACEFDFESEPDFEVTDVYLDRDSLNYAVVHGLVTLLDDSGYVDAPVAEARFYEDRGHAVLLETTERTIGSGLELAGESQRFELSHFAVYLLPALGGLDFVCAELTVEGIEPIDAGCLQWNQGT